MRATSGLLTAGTLCLLCASCGYVGDTLPPALNIASPVRDLRVIEYGDRLLADFTIPPLTTDGVVLKKLGAVELRIGVGTNPFNVDRWAEAARVVNVKATATGPEHAELPAAEWVGNDLVLAVRVINSKGRPSNWSNLISIRVIAPVEAPSGIAAVSDPKGARLTWQSTEHSFRVFRKGPADKAPALAATVESPEYIDPSAQYGTAYTYLVQALHDHAESIISSPIVFTPRDEFPPAVPGGLTAVPGVAAVELVWDRDTESDLRGYRVYRAVEGGQFEQVGEFIETPAYSDHRVEAGKRYRYAVSAVDQAGNESRMCAPVEVAAP